MAAHNAAAEKFLHTENAMEKPQDHTFSFLSFDMDAVRARPDYMVQGLFERGSMVILSGDTGSGKSWLKEALVVAILKRGHWLGREVTALGVLVIDEENPPHETRARLRALGATNEELARLFYVSLAGTEVGSPEWDHAIRQTLAEHEIDLLVIDTAMAATFVSDVNSNDEVVALYRYLRSLASKYGITVLLLHHERKISFSGSRNRGQMMMGARQWAGQADTHIALKLGEQSSTPTADGGSLLRTEVTLSVPKLRGDVPPPDERVVISSTKDAEGGLLTASVTSEGIVKKKSTKAASRSAQILELLQEQGTVMRANEISKATGIPNGSPLYNALKPLFADELVGKVGRGQYVALVGAEEQEA